MKQENYILRKIEADEGMVFDWADLEAHQREDEDGNIIQEHLYSDILFLADNDSAENYIEVERPVEE